MKTLIVICSMLKIISLTFIVFAYSDRMKFIGFITYCISTLMHEIVLMEMNEKIKRGNKND